MGPFLALIFHSKISNTLLKHFFFLRQLSLHSHGWSRARYVDQAGLEPSGICLSLPHECCDEDTTTTTVWVSHLWSARSRYPADALSQFTVAPKLTPDSSEPHPHIWSGFLSSSWSTWFKYSLIPRGFLAFTGFPPSFSDLGTLCSSLSWWKALVVAAVGCLHGWLLAAPLDLAPGPSAPWHLFQRPARGWGLVF